MKEDELPELLEAVLTERQLHALLDEIARDARDVEVTLRRRRGEPVARLPGIEDARRALLPPDGRPAAVQVRYRLGGEDFWDTLMPTPEGIRVVRTQR